MNKLNINLLGTVEINFGTEPIIDKLSAKSIAIIIILSCNLGKKITREKIASLLWAESFETANYNLRYNLWNLKKVIPKSQEGEEFILSTKEYCCINPNYPFFLDIQELYYFDEKKIENFTIDHLYAIKNLIKGEFLEQFYIKESDEFNDWILYQRTKSQKFLLQCMNQIFKLLFEEKQYQKAIAILEEILTIDPYDEEAYFKLIQLHIQRGERHLAIMQYKKCDNLLRSELNISPQKKIKELYLSLIENSREKSKIHDSRSKTHTLSMTVNHYTNEKIEYSLLCDLIEKLIEITPKQILSIIPKPYWNDVYTLQPMAIGLIDKENTEHEIKDIRLFISIKAILSYITKEYTLEVSIQNSDKIDEKTKLFLQYIQDNSQIKIKYVHKNK